MAENMDSITCSICLDLLKEPVTISCGHSYCMGCIKGCWDQDEQKGIYSCPLCKESFIPRPVLRKNTLLAELVENLKKTGLQAAAPALCYGGPGDVACDVCTGRKQKALKSCLVCLASYCETHLQPHYDAAPLKKHKLVKASTQLQEKVCSGHDEVMKMFCRTDQQCICYLCSVDEHKGHDVVSAVAERTAKQSQLSESQQKVQQRVQEREKELKEIQQAVEDYNHSAQIAVEDSDRIFTELIHCIDTMCSEVKKLIRDQQRAAVSQAKGLVKRLKQEIADLRRRDSELEQLSHTEDHIHFLQSYVSLSSPSVSSDSPSFSVRPPYFGDVSEAVSKLREKLEDILKGEWTNMSSTTKSLDLLEPQTRADFFQYSCQLTLDPNTAHTVLSLSEGNSRVTCGPAQSYPGHPERFTNYAQVLCREGLSGRCYWEVEWKGGVGIAVSYKDISRTGDDCAFGFNNKSWRLYCSNGGYKFRYNSVETTVAGPQSSRVGVYLDHRAGTLSFCSVSDTMTPLHRVHTTFTQPLYAGLAVGYGNSAELCKSRGLFSIIPY